MVPAKPDFAHVHRHTPLQPVRLNPQEANNEEDEPQDPGAACRRGWRAMTLAELQLALVRAKGDVVVDPAAYDLLLSRVPLQERAEWNYVPAFTPRGVVRVVRDAV